LNKLKSTISRKEKEEMATMFIRGHVRDYATWKPLFEEYEATRRASGISGHRLYRGIDDPNAITVVFKTEDVGRAKAFASSEDLRSVMERAGVEGPPEVWYTEGPEKKKYSPSKAETEAPVAASA
jgi:hypothetical protein